MLIIPAPTAPKQGAPTPAPELPDEAQSVRQMIYVAVEAGGAELDPQGIVRIGSDIGIGNKTIAFVSPLLALTIMALTAV